MNEGTRSEAGTAWRGGGRWPWFFSLFMLAGAAAAQPVAGDDTARQRLRIAEQRAQAETDWQARRAVCADRFIVTACMEAAEARYREQVDALDRELDRLDTQQRRLRAAERLEIIRQKSEALAAGAGASGTGRGLALPPTTDSSAAATQEPSQRNADKEIEQRRAEAARQAAQRAAAARERRLEAERRRADRERRRAESRSGAAPLPVPPAVPPAAVPGPSR